MSWKVMSNNNYCIFLIISICAIQRSFQAVNVDLVYPLCLAHLADSQLKEKLVVIPIFLSYMHRSPLCLFVRSLAFCTWILAQRIHRFIKCWASPIVF